jgi:hypothetical protein
MNDESLMNVMHERMKVNSHLLILRFCEASFIFCNNFTDLTDLRTFTETFDLAVPLYRCTHTVHHDLITTLLGCAYIHGDVHDSEWRMALLNWIRCTCTLLP